MDLFEKLKNFLLALRAARKLLNLGPWPKYEENRGRNGLPGTRWGNDHHHGAGRENYNYNFWSRRRENYNFGSFDGSALWICSMDLLAGSVRGICLMDVLDGSVR